IAFAAILGIAAVIACSTKVTPPPGQIVLAVQTDMSLPKDIDRIRIQVLIYGRPQYDQEFEAGPGGVKIPATLSIVAGKDPTAPVTIRVIARQGAKSRVLREAITTVPPDRAAVLKMPVQ